MSSTGLLDSSQPSLTRLVFTDQRARRARDLQFTESRWTRGEAFDASCPWGPRGTTADEISDPQDLRITTLVNGEIRQDASTKDIVVRIPAIIDFIAQACTLLPGDLILRGTPSEVRVRDEPAGPAQPGGHGAHRN
jgi:ureidoglycolate lyase